MTWLDNRYILIAGLLLVLTLTGCASPCGNQGCIHLWVKYDNPNKVSRVSKERTAVNNCLLCENNCPNVDVEVCKKCPPS